MSDARLARSLDGYARALARLREALAEGPENPLAVDGTIQRFEFAFELAWKAAKRALASEGLETATPREALRQAYAAGWLADETTWLGMLDDRNRTSHVYDEAAALDIYGRIRQYAPALDGLLALLQNRYPNP